MSPDTIIVQFVGSLILALLTGTATPLPPDSVSSPLPAPITFATQWHPLHQAGNQVDAIIVLGDGTTRLAATSSIVSPGGGSGRSDASSEAAAHTD